MSTEIVVAIIGTLSSLMVGVLSLIGVIITNNKANNKLVNENKTNQAVMKAKLDELTREVREHNNFATKIPVLEQKIKVLEKIIFNGKDNSL